MIDAELTIRTAYYNALNNVILSGGNRVPYYLQVPTGTSYPYIYQAGVTKVPNRTKSNWGWDVTVTLNIISLSVSNSGGQAVNDAIANQIEGIILGTIPGDTPLSFSPNFVNVENELIMSNTMPPQQATNGVVFYRILKIKHTIFQYNI